MNNKKNLHSSMDRLETNMKAVLLEDKDLFTFQYG